MTCPRRRPDADRTKIGRVGEQRFVVFEGERAAGRQAALAGNGRQPIRRVLGNDRQVLVLRDLSQPDHADGVWLHWLTSERAGLVASCSATMPKVKLT